MKSIFTSDHIVYNTDGSVDEESTNAVFANLLSSYLATTMYARERIAEAVDAVFDAHRGASLPMQYIVTSALTRLDVTPDNSADLIKMVQEYLRENADRTAEKDKETGRILVAEEPARTRKFSAIKKGRGGIHRWSDVP